VIELGITDSLETEMRPAGKTVLPYARPSAAPAYPNQQGRSRTGRSVRHNMASRLVAAGGGPAVDECPKGGERASTRVAVDLAQTCDLPSHLHARTLAVCKWLQGPGRLVAALLLHCPRCGLNHTLHPRRSCANKPRATIESPSRVQAVRDKAGVLA
jgi:hypothetical protein